MIKENKRFKKNRQLVSKQRVTDPSTTRMMRLSILEIPPRNFIPTMRCWRRFRQTVQAVGLTFILSDGHSQFLAVTNSATGNAVPYVDMWRIRRIQVYSSALGTSPTSGSVLTLIPQGLDISNNFLNDREVVYSLTPNSTMPVGMEIRPGKSTPLGGWHETSGVNPAGVLFILSSSPANINLTFMDIEFEIVPSFTGSPNGFNVNTASTTLGLLGGRPIIGASFTPASTNNLG